MISRRLERAVGMNVTDKWASVPYQVTSYGLGGLCEDHNDPYGYNEGVELTPENGKLVYSGDIFGTVMGWLSDTQAGGATTFFVNDKPLLFWPTKGDISISITALSLVESFRVLRFVHDVASSLMP